MKTPPFCTNPLNLFPHIPSLSGKALQSEFSFTYCKYDFICQVIFHRRLHFARSMANDPIPIVVSTFRECSLTRRLFPYVAGIMVHLIAAIRHRRYIKAFAQARASAVFRLAPRCS
jgi:hypothetical protein